METASSTVRLIAQWGPRCHLALLVVAGLTTTCMGVDTAQLGGGGWFAKLSAATLLGVLGLMVTHLWLLVLLRTVGLANYLWTYGFSTRGLRSIAPRDRRIRQT